MTTPLIIAALKDEVRGLKDKLAVDLTIHFKPAILHRGLFLNKELDLLITGMGSERMRKGLQETLARKIPSVILYVGYAGGASPVAPLGALVVSEFVVDEKSGRRFAAGEDLFGRAKKICDDKQWPYQAGGIVTVDRVVSSPHEKADLGAVHKVVALDMEAAVVAEIASGHGIPWLVVKSILDPVEMRLPDLQNCIEPTGEPKPLHLVEHLFKQPQDLMKLPNIQYCANQARDALARFLEAWVQTA